MQGQLTVKHTQQRVLVSIQLYLCGFLHYIFTSLVYRNVSGQPKLVHSDSFCICSHCEVGPNTL